MATNTKLPLQSDVGFDTTGNVTAGNVLTDNYLYANGQPFASYANTNVFSYLGSNSNVAITTTGQISTTGNVKANFVIGDGGLLTNVQVAAGSAIVNGTSNVTVAANGNVSFGIAGTADVASVGPAGISTTGSVTATGFSGNGALLSSVTGANVTGYVANSTHANVADAANSVAGANVTGQVANALVSGTVYTAAQPNITSLGNLTAISASGNISTTGNVTGSYILGNIANATGLGNIVSTNLNGNTATYLAGDGTWVSPAAPSAIANGTSNVSIASANGSINFNIGGNPAGGIVTNKVALGVSAGLTNQGSSTVAIGVGAGETNQGNFSVAMGVFAASSGQGTQAIAIGQAAAQISQGANAVAIGAAAGQSSQGANSIAIGRSAGTVNQPANSIIINASGSTLNGNESGFYVNPVRNDTGNVTNTMYYNATTKEITYAVASGGYGDGNVSAYLASGNNSAGYSTTGTVSAASVAGNGSQLSSITGANVTGQVANALVSGTVYTNAQPNITSVGTLTGLTSSGTVEAAVLTTGASNISLAGTTIGSTGQVITIDPKLDGSQEGNVVVLGNLQVTGNLLYNDVTTAITNNLIWQSANNASNAASASGGGLAVGPASGSYATWTYNQPANVWQSNIGISASGAVVAPSFSGNGSALSSITGANVTGQVANALVSGTVYTNAQPNITSVGTLTSLNVATTTTANVLAVSLTAGATANQGQIAWNATDLTFDMGMANGATLQVGQENYMLIKASGAIADGQVVMFAGANGDNILGAVADAQAPGFRIEYVIGVATQAIANNDFGYVTVYGKVHGLNTNAYNVGDLLWLDPTTPGAFTTTEPAAPNPKALIAAVIKKSGGDGHIMVRPTLQPTLGQLSDVNDSTVTTGDYLRYNGTAWVDATLDISDDTTPTLGGDLNGAGFVISTTGNIVGGNLITAGSLTVASIESTSLSIPWSNATALPANVIVQRGNTLFRTNGVVAAGAPFALGNVGTANTFSYISQWVSSKNLYVDPVNGDDTFDGSINTPYKTLGAALAAKANLGYTFNLLPGTYTETLTITDQNINLNGPGYGRGVNITGTWTFSHTASSIRVYGCYFDNLVYDGAGSLYLDNCGTGSLDASGTGYLSVSNSALENGNATITMGAGGNITYAALKNSTFGNLYINGNTTVTVLNSTANNANAYVAAGTLVLENSLLTSTTSNSSVVLTTVPGTVLVVNGSTFTDPDGTSSKVNIGGFWSFAGVNYDSVGSTITGANFGEPTYFDRLVSFYDTTVLGNIAVSGKITGATANIATANITTLANITASTAASSTTTGALKVAGGAGVVGNIYAGGLVSVTGNVLGGNLKTAGLISATGNVTGNYFIGNGSQLTGVVASSIANGTSNIGFSGANASINGYVAGDTGMIVTVPGTAAVAFGYQAGASLAGGGSLTTGTTSIGTYAGKVGQGYQAVAVGFQAGQLSQGANTVAVGQGAGITNQGAHSVAIGIQSGYQSQGANAVAIGAYTANSQGQGAIAIGANAVANGQTANSIVLNANGTPVTAGNAGFYVDPVRNDTGNTTNVVYFNTSTKELTYGPGGGTYGNSNVSVYLASGNANANITTTANISGSYILGNGAFLTGINAISNSATASKVSFSNFGFVNFTVNGSAGGSIGDNTVAIGVGAGPGQGSSAVAIGLNSGASNQKSFTTAVGAWSGHTNQGQGAVALGWFAGQNNQGSNSVAIGTNAGTTSQPANSIIISGGPNGLNASNAGFYVAPVRNDTGNVTNVLYYNTITNELTYGPASGGSYGNSNVSVYLASGNANANITTTANISGSYILGNGSQLTDLPSPTSLVNGNSNVVVAANSSITMTVRGSAAFAIGANTVAIGSDTPASGQGFNSVAIGYQAGQNGQGIGFGGAVAVGQKAGQNSQRNYAVAVGPQAGQNDQGSFSVAMGSSAAFSTQGNVAVAIGYSAALTGQGLGAVAIGYQAGRISQGSNAIAIGSNAGDTGQPANSIMINASGNVMNGTNQGLYIDPVRNDTGNVTNAVYYNTSTKELTYGPVGGSYGNSNVSLFLASGNANANIITSGNLFVGSTIAALPNTIASFGANVDSYAQINLQNLSNSSNAEIDIVVTADNGNDTVNFGDFGIVNSNYDPLTPTNSLGNVIFPADSYLYAQGNSGNTSQSGGNIVIGTTTSGKIVRFIVGGGNSTNMAGALTPNSVVFGTQAGGSLANAAIVANGVVAIGYQASRTNTGNYSTSVGYSAGRNGIGAYAVAIGPNAGYSNLSSNSVAIGSQAAFASSLGTIVAIGNLAGSGGMGLDSVAIGNVAATNSFGNGIVAIGNAAGYYSGDYVTTIGYRAGTSATGGTIAIGAYAASISATGNSAVYIGQYAGYQQSTAAFGSINSIGIGGNAAQTGQQWNAIAIGAFAGQTNQGNGAIAIGFSAVGSNQKGRSIAINATGTAITASNEGFYVAPVRNDESNIETVATYNTTTKEVTYATKFVAAPVASSSPGVQGQMAYDAGGNVYVCVATDTWSKLNGTTSW